MGYYAKHYKIDNTREKIHYDMFFKKGMKILDIGCAVGNFIIQDKDNIIGVEKDFESLEIAKNRRLKVVYCDIDKDKLPFNKNSFDAVNARYILEHLHNPLNLLSEAKRVLKPKGKLVLITEDAKIKKWKFYNDFTHYSPFTTNSLMQGAIEAGFKNYETFHLPVGFPFLGILYKRKIIDGKRVFKIQRLVGNIIKKQLVMICYK